MKIILADDHPLFRDGFAMLLRQIEPGAEILEACNLGEAMQLAAQHRDVDLALVDLNMPGMEGLTGLERLQREHPSLPVIVLSATESPSSVQAVLRAGASGFIPKSSTTLVMQSAIRLVMAGGIYLPPMLALADVDPVRTTSVQLTDRQLAVLIRMARGLSNKEICRELSIGEGTVKTHIATIFRVLAVSNRTEAANAARGMGLIA